MSSDTPLSGPIVEVIEDEELGGEEDNAISSTTTTLLSEEEYQEFLAEGSSNMTGKGAQITSSVGTEGAKENEAEVPKSEITGEGEQKQQAAKEESPNSEQARTTSNGEGEKDKGEVVEEKVGDTKLPSKGTEKGEDVEGEGKQGEGKSQSEKATDQDSEGSVPETAASKDLPTKRDSDNQQDKVDSEVDGATEEKPAAGDTTGKKQREGEASENRDHPPAVSSALERRLTSYGNNRATSVSKQRRLSGMSSTHPTGPTGPGHVWDHVMLNCPQFVQLVELFLGVDPEDAIVDAVSSFIRINYTETAQVHVCAWTWERSCVHHRVPLLSPIPFYSHECSPH